jgi:glutaminyl-peptide cyclotransferase
MSEGQRAKSIGQRAKSEASYAIWSMLLALCSMLFVLSSVLHALPAQPVFDADRAFKYLQKQCEFGPRPPGSAAHKRTLDYLLSELRKSAREVVSQNFIYQSADGPLDLTNIIAIFGPRTGLGSAPTEKVLLAAHWDTRPFADRDPDPEKRHLPILGANDGASGVAVLLELSRTFHSKPPDIQVIMVLFDGEDYGKTIDEMLLGSQYFVRNMDDGWRPEYGVLIDMVGDKDLDIYIEPNSAAAAPDIVKKVWELADELRLEGIYSEPGPAVLDDHIPLIEAGIKCIDIIDFNYPYWHSVEDTPDKCSPKSLETVGRLLLELIYRKGPVSSH